MKKFTLFLTLILSLSILLTGCSATDYKKAMNLFAEGSFHEAADMFSDLGDYKDSSDMYKRSRYSYADQLLSEGDYEYAREIFEALGSYKDAEDRLEDCDFCQAESLYNKEDFSSALTIFDSLSSQAASEKADLCRIELSKIAYAEQRWADVVSLLTRKDGSFVSDLSSDVSTMLLLSRAHVAYDAEDYDSVLTLLENYENKDNEEIYVTALTGRAAIALEKDLNAAVSNLDSTAVSDALASYYASSDDSSLPEQKLSETFASFVETTDYSLFRFMEEVVDATEDYDFNGTLSSILDSAYENHVFAFLTSTQWIRTNGSTHAEGLVGEVIESDGIYNFVIIDNSRASGYLFFPGDIKWIDITPTDSSHFDVEDYYVTYSLSDYSILGTQYDLGVGEIDFDTQTITMRIYMDNTTQYWVPFTE